MACFTCYTVWTVIIGLVGYFLHKSYKEKKKQQMLERWNNTPKDEIVLHTFGRAKTIVTAALFCLKAETYLRLANIKYTLDFKDATGPKGKAPWISINGKHVSDTQFIMEFLNKKFDKDLNKHLDPTSLATAQMVRIMMEEYFMWGMAMERFAFSPAESFGKVVGASGFMFNMYIKYFSRGIIKKAVAQGLGVHSKEEIRHLMSSCLRTANVALGNRKFFGGDEPCQEDAGIFAILAQCLWGLPNSHYEKLLNDELTNLKNYLIRMKEKAWPDWDVIIKS